MRKTILILLLALWPALAHAQSITTVASALKGGATLPATCKPATSGSRADVFIKTGSSAGLYTCSAANTWTAVGGSSSSGDVVGPASATDNAVVRFDGTTGKLVQDSAVTIADTTGDITAGKYNKVTLTAPATGSTLTILNGKTLTANNTLTLAGTDDSTLNVGAGGTLGSAAFTAASAYEVPLTFGSGVARSTNAISLDQSFAPTWTGIHTFNNGVTTGTGSTAGTVFTYNSLTTGDGAGISSSSATSGKLVNLAITGTAALTNNTVLNISNSGATSTNAQTTYGAIISNTRTNATSGTNVALQLTASGATTSNVALNVTAGASLFPSGTAALPSVGIGSSTSGLYDETGSLGLSAGGVARVTVTSQPSIRLAATTRFEWNSGVIGGGGPDLILRRANTANLAFGAADAASPTAQTISVQNVVAGTSNTAGANFTIAGSRGTGTGTGGSLIFQVAPAGSTGTSQNALATALTIDSTKAATFTGDLQATTATFSGAISVASCSGCGGSTTYATSGNYWPFPQETMGTAANSAALVGSANEVRCGRVFLNRAITVDRLGIKGAGGSAGLASFGVYTFDGSSRTAYSGTVDTNTGWTTAQAVTLSSSGTVGPGYVMVCWTADNTSATIFTHNYNSNIQQAMTVGNSKVIGTCSNTATSGALPSTCGTFTADSTITNWPFLNWFKN